MLSAKRDGIHWRGFAPGRFRRGFFVGRIGPARIVVHGVMLQKYRIKGKPKRAAPIRAHSRVFMVDAPKNRTVVPFCF